MLTRIKMFFTMKEYRSLVFYFLKKRIWFIISFPFIWVKSWIDAIRFVKETPDQWDRYVKLKEMENENEKNERRYQLSILVSQAMGSVTRMTIMMFMAFYSYDVPNYSEEDAQSKFDADKAETIDTFDKMEEIVGKVPEELRELVENCQLRTYTTKDDISDFGDKARNMIGEIRI